MARNPVRPAQVDTIALACTIWAGTACAIGDIRGCVLVVLVMALAAVFRSQAAESRPERIVGEKAGLLQSAGAIAAVDTSLLARAPSFAEVFAHVPQQGVATPEYEPVQSELDGAAPAVASVVRLHPDAAIPSPHEEASATAQQLKLLAQALRGSPARSAAWLQQPAVVYQRRSQRIPDHNVAVSQSGKPTVFTGGQTGAKSFYQPAGQ